MTAPQFFGGCSSVFQANLESSVSQSTETSTVEKRRVKTLPVLAIGPSGRP